MGEGGARGGAGGELGISKPWLVVAVLLQFSALSTPQGLYASPSAAAPRNGAYTLQISDTSGAPVRHAFTPRTRQLLLEAHRALHEIERARAEVLRVERRARSLSDDERRCTEDASRRAADIATDARVAYMGVRRQMVEGRFVAARNHYAVITELRTQAEAQRLRAPECLTQRYRHSGCARVTVNQGARQPSPRRAFWDRRDASHRNVIK